MILFSQIKLILLATTFSIIVGAVGAGYLKYKLMVSNIKELEAETQQLQIHNKQLKNSIDEQKHVIENLESSIVEQREINIDLQETIASANKDVEKLETVIRKHSLTRIASRKASLLQKKINNATLDVLRCFEIVTGEELKLDEKNSQCTNLISSSK
jgi:septal ring factor EnvC (AmiA/AmiB activator)